MKKLIAVFIISSALISNYVQATTKVSEPHINSAKIRCETVEGNEVRSN